MVGEILNGRYEVLKPIGFGGMAEVYLARDVLLDRKVAIKIMRKEFVNNKAQMEQFKREAKSAARLIHPSIINIYDVCEDKNLNYIVMEYVEGVTLKAFEEQHGRLDPSLAVALTLQLASALEHAHSHNIIHCDIKPQNIVLTESMQPKIVDFGISKIVSNETMAFTASVVGSVHYFSPEQAQGLKITAQSDIYSLGIVFYEMLTGHVPFDGSTAVAVARKQVEEQPPRLADDWPRAPEALQQILDKALAKDLDKRYQSAAEMRHDLVQAKKELYPDGAHSYLEDTMPLGEAAASVPLAVESRPEPRRNEDEGEKTLIMKLPSFLTEEVDDEPEAAEEAGHRTGKFHPDESWGAQGGREAGNRPDLPDPSPAGRKKKAGFLAGHPRLKKILTGVLAVFLVLFLGCLYYFNSTTPEIEVPDVNGMPVAEAQKVLEEKGFRVELEESMDKNVTPGTVLKMDPAAGTKRKEGARITLTIARGLKLSPIPDVTGLDLSQAEKLLQEKGFRVGKVTNAWEDGKPEGLVLRQLPTAGSRLNEGGGVDLVVNRKETAKAELPNLTGLVLKDAKAKLEAMKLKVGQVITVDSDKEEGTVLSTNPSAGEALAEGTSVDLRVSNGQGGSTGGSEGGGSASTGSRRASRYVEFIVPGTGPHHVQVISTTGSSQTVEVSGKYPGGSRLRQRINGNASSVRFFVDGKLIEEKNW